MGVGRPAPSRRSASRTGEGTASCIGPCEKIDNPTSVGCEFLAIRMNSFNIEDTDKDVLIVGNTDTARTAEVQL